MDRNLIQPPSPVNSLTTYNVKPISGDESVDVLVRTRDSAIRMVRDEENKGNTQEWKTLTTLWVVANSTAYEVWRRPDIESVDALFDNLIEKKNLSQTTMDDTHYKYLQKLRKPASMDAHYVEMYEYHAKFFDDKIKSDLSTTLNEKIKIPSLNTAFFEEGLGAQVKSNILSEIENDKAQIITAFKKNYIESRLRTEIQGLIAPEPELIRYFDPAKSPLVLTASQLTNTIQNKILLGAPNGPYHISMRDGFNVKPLTQIAANNTNNGQNNNADKQDSNIQVNPTFTPKLKNKRGQQPFQQQPSNNNNNINNKNIATVPKFKKQKQQFQKQIINNNPNQGKKFCYFCKTKYPNSTTCDGHYPNQCFRNPKNGPGIYDSVKAKIDPKN